MDQGVTFRSQKLSATFTGVANDRILWQDQAFDQLFPTNIRHLSEMHWTPLDVAMLAGNFLADPGARVLDIGSGAGKFCIAAGFRHPYTLFFGIEQRAALVSCAEKACTQTGIINVSFRHGDLTELQGRDYDHFYFYNPFCENVSGWGKIDDEVPVSFDRYQRYIAYFQEMLGQKPAGTKLATYYTPDKQVPEGYRLLSSHYKKGLKLWIRK